MKPRTSSGIRRKDMTGQVCNRWTVLAFSHILESSGTKRAYWLAKCECGTIKAVDGQALRSGRTKSCGCWNLEAFQKRVTGHGMSYTGVYQYWKTMRARVASKRPYIASRYRDRGIVVCEYFQVFENFLKDMGFPPTNKHTVDRIDNDLNYSCGHCEQCVKNGWPMNLRWATRKEQSRNTSSNRLITFNNETLTVAEWSERIGHSRTGILWRLDNGWTVEEALGFKEHVRGGA